MGNGRSSRSRASHTTAVGGAIGNRSRKSNLHRRNKAIKLLRVGVFRRVPGYKAPILSQTKEYQSQSEYVTPIVVLVVGSFMEGCCKGCRSWLTE